MPDLDTGHLFLTTLAPIKRGAPEGVSQASYEQQVRIALAELPPAKQSPATVNSRFNSPFARNRQNHFVRAFVLENAVYNGRNPENALVATIRGQNTIDPQPVDQLSTSYLVLCADIDAIEQEGQPLPDKLTADQQQKVRRAYAITLWETMGEELQSIYSNCIGFEGIDTAEDFANYLERCHVETTMPFHDYYLKLPKFHILPIKLLINLVIWPAIAGLVALMFWLFGMKTLPGLGWSSLLTGALALGCAAVGVFFGISYALRNGQKPLAPGQYDDLPSVLKALYTQQHFAGFATENQGASDDDLYAAFGTFLETHKPETISGPTQVPGVISSLSPENVSP